MRSGKTLLGHALRVCALIASLMATAPAAAQDSQPSAADPEAAPDPPAAEPGGEPAPGLWRHTAAGIKNIWGSGGSDVYVPGYIWHLPYKYSDEQIARYNTAAWGIGYGRTLRGSGVDHPRTLYAIVSADSYANPQYMLGYAWRARWHPGGGAFSFSGGYTALVIGRQDKASYAPLPMVLPLGTVGLDRFELMGAYVPYFEIGYFFLRLNFGEGPRASPQK
jgi:palmitoyl transferase